MIEQEYHNKQWGVLDFGRYHSGQMPPLEMHALEKAALDDPFLDDALEGYAYTKTPVADIAALKNKLNPQKEQAKIVWYNQKGVSQFLKIAAALILFAGFAWLLDNNKEDKQVEMATISKTLTPIAPTDDAASATMASTDTENIVAHDKTNDPLTEKDKTSFIASAKKTKPVVADKEEVASNVPAAIVSDAQPLNDVAIAEKPKLFDREKAAAPSANVNQELQGRLSGVNVNPSQESIRIRGSNSINQNTINGRVVDDAGKPVPYASINDSKNKILLSADKDGYFSINNNNNAATVKVDVDALGFAKTNAALNAANAENIIILKESNQALSEVVVTGYGQAKSKKQMYSSASKKDAAKFVNTINWVMLKNAAPLAGWLNFNQFISDSLKNKSIVPAINNKEVILLFDLDSKGNAKNISIKKSLSDSLNTVAKNILQAAPAMKKNKKGTKAEAVIRF